MANLAARSILVLALLFGLLFAVGAGVMAYYNVNVGWAVALALVVVFLQYLVGPYIISWIFKINWVDPASVRADIPGMIEESCRKHGIPIPTFGIIEDGNPNAFTFGHYPGNARVVVTRGLVEMLEPDELHAVIAHELGHIKHWDFVVMTIASAIPVALYMIWRFGMGRRRGRDSGYAVVVAIGAYVAYVLSQYIALLLSRVREYYADYYSAHDTGKPNALASALVKIAYGLAKLPPKAEGEKDKGFAHSAAAGASSLGIFSFSAAVPFAISSLGANGQMSPTATAAAMRWDLRNPWAKWFELHSTHPLPAKRIFELERMTQLSGGQPSIPIEAGYQESLWPTFFRDVLFAAMPWLPLLLIPILGFAAISSQNPEHLKLIGWIVAACGLGLMIRLTYCYPKRFMPGSVRELVGEVEVSHIKSVPVEMEGTVIGRGIPGLFYAKDLVLQDDTGFITLQYRQPLGFLEFLFGLLKADQMIGKKVKVTGWYRRGPSPYLEVWRAHADTGEGFKCYWYGSQVFVAVAMIVVGLLLGLALGGL